MIYCDCITQPFLVMRNGVDVCCVCGREQRVKEVTGNLPVRSDRKEEPSESQTPNPHGLDHRSGDRSVH